MKPIEVANALVFVAVGVACATCFVLGKSTDAAVLLAFIGGHCLPSPRMPRSGASS